MMNHFSEISSSENAEAQHVSYGGNLRLSNLGQRELLLAMAQKGAAMRTTARGFSMQPLIRDKDVLTISPIKDKKPGKGDVVAFTNPETGKLAIHRIIGRADKGWIIKGDNCVDPDGLVPVESIIGYVCCVERGGSEVRLCIGNARALIAILNKSNILTRWNQGMMLLREAAGRILQSLQSMKAYRRLAGLLAPPIDISEASENDMEAVHQMFNPEVPYCRQDLNPNVTNWVAKRDSEIIAFTQNVYHPEEHHPWVGHWLFSLHVRVRYRGAGIGEKLTKCAVDKAKEEGAEQLFLVVFEDNKRAFRLYRKFGFENIVLSALEPLLAEEKVKTARRRIVMRKKLR